MADDDPLLAASAAIVTAARCLFNKNHIVSIRKDKVSGFGQSLAIRFARS